MWYDPQRCDHEDMPADRVCRSCAVQEVMRANVKMWDDLAVPGSPLTVLFIDGKGKPLVKWNVDGEDWDLLSMQIGAWINQHNSKRDKEKGSRNGEGSR